MVKCDSKTALAQLSNPIISARTKHIDIRHHFIRDLISEGAALFQWVPSKQNLADALTKALPATEHFRLFQSMMRDWDKGRWLDEDDAPVLPSTDAEDEPGPPSKKLKISASKRL